MTDRRFSSTATAPALLGLLGVSVLLSFFTSYAATLGPAHGPELENGLVYLAGVGRAGASLFLAVVGYEAYRRAREPGFRLGAFLEHSARRLYPAYLAALVAALILRHLLSSGSLPRGAQGWAYGLANVLLLPGVVPLAPIVPGGYVLSLAALGWVVVPSAVRLLRVPVRPRWQRLALIALGALAALLAGHARPLLYPLTLLAVGCGAVEAVPVRRRWAATLVLPWGLVAAYVVREGAAAPGTTGELLRTLVLAAVCFLTLRAAADPESYLSQTLSLAPLSGAGRIALPWYLTHGLLLEAVALLLQRFHGIHHSEGQAWALLAPVAGLTLLLAWAVSRKVTTRAAPLLAHPLPQAAVTFAHTHASSGTRPPC